jgi:biotin-(acetyl-CoA carboxylase) ligase
MLLTDKWDKSYVGNLDVFVFIAGKQNLGKGQRQNKW